MCNVGLLKSKLINSLDKYGLASKIDLSNLIFPGAYVEVHTSQNYNS